MQCPLCGTKELAFYHQDKRRPYHQCQCCQLVFVDPGFYISADEEKSEYDLHENNPEDEGYRRFLSRLCDPLIERLPVAAKGLDFGCGPGPALCHMLAEQGFEVLNYDLFYANDKALLAQSYDFITATEVIEHISRPDQVLPQLWGMLRPGGYLALMTKLVIDQAAFANWHYKNDKTHICFYSEATFNWLGTGWGVVPEIIGKDVIIFQKP